jgi:cellulose synthase/poly-beta-1,6-N-acetylglucosamine synthase-like glycosyltransferase
MYSKNYPPHLNSTFINEARRNLIKKEDVTIVIPTLNEENAIELVLKDVLLEGYLKTLVIDGNSADKTVKIVEKIGFPYTLRAAGARQAP